MGITVFGKKMPNEEWKKICEQLSKLLNPSHHSTRPLLKQVNQLIGKTKKGEGASITGLNLPEGWNKQEEPEKKDEKEEKKDEKNWWEGLDSGAIFAMISAACFVTFGLCYMAFGQVEPPPKDDSSSSSIEIPHLFAPMDPRSSVYS